jgi:hypothetical protein
MLDFGSTTKGKHPVDAIHFMAQHGVLKMRLKSSLDKHSLNTFEILFKNSIPSSLVSKAKISSRKG